MRICIVVCILLGGFHYALGYSQVVGVTSLFGLNCSVRGAIKDSLPTQYADLSNLLFKSTHLEERKGGHCIESEEQAISPNIKFKVTICYRDNPRGFDYFMKVFFADQNKTISTGPFSFSNRDGQRITLGEEGGRESVMTDKGEMSWIYFNCEPIRPAAQNFVATLTKGAGCVMGNIGHLIEGSIENGHLTPAHKDPERLARRSFLCADLSYETITDPFVHLKNLASDFQGCFEYKPEEKQFLIKTGEDSDACISNIDKVEGFFQLVEDDSKGRVFCFPNSGQNHSRSGKMKYGLLPCSRDELLSTFQ